MQLILPVCRRFSLSFRFLPSILLLVCLYCSPAQAFPLLQAEYLNICHAMHTESDRETLLGLLVDYAEIPVPERDNAIKYLLAEPSDQSIAWARSAVQSAVQNKNDGHWFVGQFVLHNKLRTPNDAAEYSRSILSSDTTSRPMRWHFFVRWLQLAESAEADFPIDPVPPRVQSFLEGYRRPLSSVELSLLKAELDSYIASSADSLNKGLEDRDSYSGFIVLNRIYLAQVFDAAYSDDCLQNASIGNQWSRFLFEMNWQATPQYVDATLNGVLHLRDSGPIIFVDSPDQHAMVFERFSGFLVDNSDAPQVIDFVAETIGEKPGSFYPYLDKISPVIRDRGDALKSHETLQKQLNVFRRLAVDIDPVSADPPRFSTQRVPP